MLQNLGLGRKILLANLAIEKGRPETISTNLFYNICEARWMPKSIVKLNF
jgi:hypothetical protein